MKMFKLTMVSFVLIMSGAINTFGQTTNYQVFSLFVMNIAKYSAWPATQPEFQITVFGKSKVHDELMKYTDRGVNGMKIKVLQVESISEVGQPQIVYLSDGKSSQLDELLKSTEGKPVMIITEREGLHKKGAGFSFFINETQNLRFDINNTELEKRKIKVAKNLTSMAHEIL